MTRQEEVLARYVAESKKMVEAGGRIQHLLECRRELTGDRPPDWKLVVETIGINDTLQAVVDQLVLAVQAYETEADPVVAEALCKRAHEGQTRDDGRPYSAHPESVVNILRERGLLDPITECIAWTHDVPEDTSHTIEEITALLGSSVGRGVALLTNKHPDGTPFDVRQEALLKHAAKMRFTERAVLVKLADRFDNLSDMDHFEPWRRKRYAEAALDLVDAMEPIRKGSQLARDVRALAQRIIAVPNYPCNAVG